MPDPTLDRISGAMVIASEPVMGTEAGVRSSDPRDGADLDPVYPTASAEQIERACEAAAQSFPQFRSTTAPRRAAFLDRIADLLDERIDELVARAHAESALPVGRLTGEVGRTSKQLRMFAAELRRGTWQGVRIDPARTGATVSPDIRQRRVAIGPVVVFGASNFPLAFSTAGGDTASALAAGCPVIVKAHPAHLGTSELAARVIAEAAVDTGMPAGVFSHLVGRDTTIGTTLVADRRICAVGFTGSRGGGLALAAVAAARPKPIPVYAEMSSVNPVVLLPAALGARGGELGAEYAGSLTLGGGQFCTNPGLVLAIDGSGLDAFIQSATNAVNSGTGAVMLSTAIAESYAAEADSLAARDGVAELAHGARPTGPATGAARLLTVDGARFVDDPALQTEVFGATSLIVRCEDLAELVVAVNTLEGQLTSTVHATAADHPMAARLLPLLEERSGRIVFNGWPTGVEVGHAMVHGGPFPATTNSATTSVGSLAIERFLRPIAYQDVPTDLMPDELRDDNSLGVWRRLSGEVNNDTHGPA